jgi:hypothetical protein
MRFQLLLDTVRQERHAIFHALAIANHDLVVTKINILDPKAQTFHQPKSCSIKELYDQPVNIEKCCDCLSRFLPGQYRRYSSSSFGSHCLNVIAQICAQHLFIKKQQSIERLILRGGGHFQIGGQIRQKIFNLLRAHILGMTFVIIQDKPSYPGDVRLFCPPGIVLRPDDLTHLIQ